MSIEKQKEVTSNVLNVLRKAGFSDVLVCGGAPRDWYMGNEANDVDVYVGASGRGFISVGEVIGCIFGFTGYRYMCDESVEDLQIGCDLLGITNTQTNTSVPEQYRHNKYLNQVTECKIEGVTFQFMDITGTNTMVGSYAMFPFNLCLATYDGERVRTSELFDMGIREKVLCKINSEYDEHETYVAKIKGRFSDFRYCSKVTEWFFPE